MDETETPGTERVLASLEPEFKSRRLDWRLSAPMSAESLFLAVVEASAGGEVVVLARRGYAHAVSVIPQGKFDSLLPFVDRLSAASPLRPKRAEQQDFGHTLHNLIVSGDVADLYKKVGKTDGLRIEVLGRGAVGRLAWEYIGEPGLAFGPRINRPVIRLVGTDDPTPPEPMVLQNSSELNVLYASASPVNYPPPDPERMKRRIQQQLDSEAGKYRNWFETKGPGRLHLKEIRAASANEIWSALGGRQFEVFHFHGHGIVDNGRGFLLLSRSGGAESAESDRVSAEDLINLLQPRPQLVVLSACRSSAGDPTLRFAVIAEELVRAGIPAVVANQASVFDDTMAEFAAELYSNLLRSNDIDLAFARARCELYNKLRVNDESPPDWGIPTLHRRPGASSLFRIKV